MQFSFCVGTTSWTCLITKEASELENKKIWAHQDKKALISFQERKNLIDESQLNKQVIRLLFSELKCQVITKKGC